MRKAYSAMKYVCIAALVISMIALVAVVAYVLINGVDKLSLNLVFGEYIIKNIPKFWGYFYCSSIKKFVIYIMKYEENKSRISF